MEIIPKFDLTGAFMWQEVCEEKLLFRKKAPPEKWLNITIKTLKK